VPLLCSSSVNACLAVYIVVGLLATILHAYPAGTDPSEVPHFQLTRRLQDSFNAVFDAQHALYRSAAPNRHAIHPELAPVISASGSAGSPRLLRLSSGNLESSPGQTDQALHYTPPDRTMVIALIFNGYGQSVIQGSAAPGGSFVLTR
jgi:acyl-CoA synthetase (AMP-forming)/AMP-acid ligase II